MNCHYKIDPKNQVIIETFSEDFTLQGYIAHKNKLHNDPEFSPNYHIIADLRKTSINKMHTDAIENMISFLANNKDKISNRKSAIVTSTPKQVVNSFIFSKYARELSIKIKIFSTFEAALDWINEPQ